MESSEKTKNKYWDEWTRYAEFMGVDPYLSEDTTTFTRAIRSISGFAGRVKTGFFGYSREVGSSTVRTALTAVGQKISMDRGYNPLKLNGSDKYLYPLQRMLEGFRKWDAPTNKKLPVEVDVVNLLCAGGQTKLASTKDDVLGD